MISDDSKRKGVADPDNGQGSAKRSRTKTGPAVVANKPAKVEPRQKVVLVAQTNMGIKAKNKLIDTRTHQKAAVKLLMRAKKKVARQILIDQVFKKKGDQ